MADQELVEVLERLNLFQTMYDEIRLVDPMKKLELYYRDNQIVESGFRCFNLWGKSGMCNNCISIRAYQENETFIKLEYMKDKVYIVTAVPLEFEQRKVVVELLSNTKNSILYQNQDMQNASEVYALIDEMNNLALRDSLTNIYNRRYLSEKLPVELINATLSEQYLSVCMVDIDLFKHINDQFGHLAGDEVIKAVALTLQNSLKRESDWVARFGGEEFFVCLPGANEKKAVEITEHMRKSLENLEVTYEDKTMKITASFGVCSVKGSSGRVMDTLVASADQNMYKAKEMGRNKVVSTCLM